MAHTEGLGELNIVIQRNESGDDRLPTALTCFSRLLLPEYKSELQLRERMMLAMEHGKGFGLA
jgi:ubiquitin-protein ligase E3 A